MILVTYKMRTKKLRKYAILRKLVCVHANFQRKKVY